MDKITVLLADDHPIVRRGLRRELEQSGDLAVVAEAGSVGEAVERAGQTRPRVAVVDARLPDGNGIEACWHIMRRSPGTAVLILTAFDWDVYLARTWEAGAAGFLVKAADTNELVEAIRQAAQGQRLWTPEQLQRVRAWQAEVGKRLAALSSREYEVLRLMAEGHTNSEIARMLALAVKTVERHVSQILTKLEIASRRQVAAWARRTGALER